MDAGMWTPYFSVFPFFSFSQQKWYLPAESELVHKLLSSWTLIPLVMPRGQRARSVVVRYHPGAKTLTYFLVSYLWGCTRPMAQKKLYFGPGLGQGRIRAGLGTFGMEYNAKNKNRVESGQNSTLRWNRRNVKKKYIGCLATEITFVKKNYPRRNPNFAEESRTCLNVVFISFTCTRATVA